MAGKRSGGKGRAARRREHVERLTASSTGARDEARARAREEAVRAAAAVPSAARWLVTDPDGDATPPAVVAVDVVADLLALDPRTSLRGRGGERLRALARHVAELVALGAVTPSGRSLVEVVSPDEAVRDRLAPSFDLDALLGGGPVASDVHDRTIVAAEALLDRAARHREGVIDLHAEVAPVGSPRHDHADEVEATVRLATEGLAVPAGPEPAVVTITGGWVGVGPVELFLAAGRGLLGATAADVGGAALAGWLHRVRDAPDDACWTALRGRVAVDASALLQEVSARAGSDHPDVVGGALVELIALRHPIAPPAR